MSELAQTIRAHFIHKENGLYSVRHLRHAPSVGDELRFDGDKFFVVTRKVWVYDEPEQKFSRLNVEITEAP